MFLTPGEFVVANALTIFKAQQGHKVKFEELKKLTEKRIKNANAITGLCFDHPLWDEMLYRNSKYLSKYGVPFFDLPFLGTSTISLNVHEFIRNWTLFNFGEVASFSGHVMDNHLSKFTRLLLRQAGLSNVINIDVEAQEPDHDLTILVLHANLDE